MSSQLLLIGGLLLIALSAGIAGGILWQRRFAAARLPGRAAALTLKSPASLPTDDLNTQKRLEELLTINAISQAAAAHLDLEALLNLVGDRIQALFKAHAVYIALLDKPANLVRIPYYHYRQERLEGKILKVGEGLTGKILERRQPLVINYNFLEESTLLGLVPIIGKRDGAYAKSWLGVPIFVGEEAIGVISAQDFEREGLFTEDDVRLLSTVAANIGIAFRNAELYEQSQRELSERTRAQEELRQVNNRLQTQLAEIKVLQAQLHHQAIRDPLTDLYNRRFLEETLERELSRAERDKTQVAVVMLDIDHFKRLNDTYGHKAGDLMLQSLANLLRTQSRRGDVACRFGGEEFVVVLPGASLLNAQERAEKWRREFENTQVTDGRRLLSTTLSLGIAVYPVHGASAEQLLGAADAALYQAKDIGRNQTILSKAAS